MAQRKLLIAKGMLPLTQQLVALSGATIEGSEDAERLDHVLMIVKHDALAAGAEPLTVIFGHQWVRGQCRIMAMIGEVDELVHQVSAMGSRVKDTDGNMVEPLPAN